MRQFVTEPKSAGISLQRENGRGEETSRLWELTRFGGWWKLVVRVRTDIANVHDSSEQSRI